MRYNKIDTSVDEDSDMQRLGFAKVKVKWWN
jgi:hypothetical protein